MTGPELTALLLTILSGATGRERTHWQRVLGSVRLHLISTHQRCNWKIALSGSPADVDAADRALDVVRAAHPYVR